MSDEYWHPFRDAPLHIYQRDRMGPMTKRQAENVTRGMLINMRDDCFVDEWPADEERRAEG